MNLKFLMPVEMISEENCIEKNKEIFTRYGKKCLIVTGSRSAKLCGALDDVISVLQESEVEYAIFDKVEQNPSVTTCYQGGLEAAAMGAEYIIGIGGGSPLDAAKAIAVYGANPTQDKHCVYEGWNNQALPIILIGTTAGTGSEVTPYSVLTHDETGMKKSFCAKDTFASVALGDAKYQRSLSYHFTVSTALDAICHGAESYFNLKSDAISDMFALECIREAIETLIQIEGKNDISHAQRVRLYHASLYGGVAISRTGTALCHCMGYPLSEELQIPHGFATAIYLPAFVQFSSMFDAQKTTRLFQCLNMNQETFATIIYRLCDVDLSAMTLEQKERWLKRFDGHPNMAKNLGSITGEEITEILEGALKRYHGEHLL